MQDYGKVSIITASWNCADFIGETIESITAQTYKNWELLITDDCSTDNSREVIAEYTKRDSRIKLFKLKKNSGAGIARNNSIEHASGRYIAFCDSDDRWMPNKLERQIGFMAENNYGLTYTSYDTCNESGEIIGYVECLPRLSRAKILRDNGIGCLTAIYDTNIIGKHFMPSIRKRQDWCLWIDIISSHGAAYGLREPLALYRVRQGSISSNKVQMLKYNYNVYHQVLGYNPVWSACLLGGYFLPYYFYKKFKQKQDYKKRLKQ
ncbi:glycosyltransferase family 2 protein [uncultured Duncaniella sp.]|uniref:glycosyltransferase family 2 protein n=1 Tax=uncultured Duncaniella sp. TaxID=2768039 RepID=UPI002601CFBC|nr:glycosyltransferase family 2 protein [uncultured Duncaniella sp.]